MNADTKTLEQRASDWKLIDEAVGFAPHDVRDPARLAFYRLRDLSLSSAAEAKGEPVAWQAVYPDGTRYGDPVTYVTPYMLRWNEENGHPLRPLVYASAADEADAAGVGTVCRSEPTKCGTCEPEGVFDTEGNGPFDCYACGKKGSGEAEEPYAWEWRSRDDLHWGEWTRCTKYAAESVKGREDFQVRGLYLTPAASAVPPQYERAYIIANHFDSTKGGLPDEWQDWAEEISRDLRSLASVPSPETEGE